jgi:hypothetical protein
MRIGGKVEVGGKHMRSAISEFTRPHLRPSFLLLGAFLAVAPISIYGSSQSENSAGSTATAAKIPAGTILPVALQTSLAFAKCKPGQILRGKIAQDVPLLNGSKIQKGSLLEGRVVEAVANSNGAGATVTIQFDELQMAGKWVSIVTDLRAIAGSMAVQAAVVPVEAPGEGSTYVWLPTTQIGGDSVYGLGGPVTSAQDSSKVIGKSVADGVLVQVSAKEGAGCRGDMGNNRPQALWVFSGDACGAYGIEHLKIAHAGRTDPKGRIVLASDDQKLKLRVGDALLLRVD